MESDGAPRDLRALTKVHDPENRNTFVSLYANLEGVHDEHALDQRAKACRTILKRDKDLLTNFEASLAEAQGLLKRFKGRGITGEGSRMKGAAIFVSKANGLLSAHMLALPVKDQLVVDSSPYVRPLIKLQEEFESAAVVLVSQQEVKLYELSILGQRRHRSLSKDIIGRHKKGGCSQARFQRLRRGAIKEFLASAAKQIDELMEQRDLEQLVLAGPGTAKGELLDLLPERRQRQVVEQLDFHFEESPEELFLLARKALAEEEGRDEIDHISELMDEVLSDGLGVYGQNETRWALELGKVELLLLTEGLQRPGLKCEPCNYIEPEPRETCPTCERPMTQIDLIEEVVELAHNTDAEVDFIKGSDELEALGGVAALLRYR